MKSVVLEKHEFGKQNEAKLEKTLALSHYQDPNARN